MQVDVGNKFTYLYTMKWRGAQWQLERDFPPPPFRSVSVDVLLW